MKKQVCFTLLQKPYVRRSLFLTLYFLGGLLSFCRATSPDAQFVEELRFALPHNGNCHYKLVAMCDAYEGLDVVGDIRIKGKQ